MEKVTRHFTVTTYLFKEDRVLLIMHPKFGKWLPPGGHLEADEIPHEGAAREVQEETGLEIAFILQENISIDVWNARSIPRPFLCLLEKVPMHKETPAHEHIDLIFLARPISGEEKEEVHWFTLAEVLAMKNDEIFEDTQQVVSLFFKSDLFEASTL